MKSIIYLGGALASPNVYGPRAFLRALRYPSLSCIESIRTGASGSKTRSLSTGSRDTDHSSEIDLDELEKRVQNLELEFKERGIAYQKFEGPSGIETHPDFIKSIRESEGVPEGPIVLASTEGLDEDETVSTVLQNLKKDAVAMLYAASMEDVELSITLCGDETIQKYNKQHRQIDAPTDVLSFPMEDEYMIGDLIISVETAERQAQERSHDLHDELRILLIHGFLHLIGYDHETSKEDWEEMASAESRLMRRLEWKGKGLISLAEDD